MVRSAPPRTSGPRIAQNRMRAQFHGTSATISARAAACRSSILMMPPAWLGRRADLMKRLAGRRLRLGAGLDARLELGAELGQKAEHRPGSGLAERADGVAR